MAGRKISKAMAGAEKCRRGALRGDGGRLSTARADNGGGSMEKDGTMCLHYCDGGKAN